MRVGTELVRSTLRTLATLLVAVAAVWAFAAWRGYTVEDLRHFGEPHNLVRVDGEELRIPRAEGPAVRRLPAVTATTSGAHTFMFDEGSGPVRYDPCRELAWVLNPSGMPDAAEPLVHAAVESVQRATGLKFAFVGTTTEAASFDRDLFQEQYGDGFAPIIIGFATHETNAELEGAVTGIGGSSAVYAAYGDEQFLHSGTVILDADDIERLMSAEGGDAIAQAVVQHELGHVVGLGHVDDESELMHPQNTHLTEWGPGDLEGLAVVGDGPCEDA